MSDQSDTDPPKRRRPRKPGNKPNRGRDKPAARGARQGQGQGSGKGSGSGKGQGQGKDRPAKRPPGGRRPAAARGQDGDAGARRAAAFLLQAVLGDKQPLDEAMDQASAQGALLARLSPRDRAFARLLAATVLRRLGEIDQVLALCLDRPLPKRADNVQNILRLGIAQLLYLGTKSHAAVNGAVALLPRESKFRGLVNALLRRIDRDGLSLRDGLDADRLNCPDWLWQSWCHSYGEAQARQIIHAHYAEPPLDFSVKADPAAWANRLEAQTLPGGALRRRRAGLVTKLPGYEEGAWWIQDAAAQIPVRLLGPLKGRQVLDLCAAPGGKSLQLCAAGAVVTAVDQSAARLKHMHDNLQRMGAEATIVEADILQWRPPALFDAVLLDAPCSATGSMRRHPDIWRLKSAADVDRLSRIQERMLMRALGMVKPGGLLLYCTCSLEAQEGPDRIAAFLQASRQRGAPVVRVPISQEEVPGLEQAVTEGGDLRTLPSHWSERGGIDGFFIARMRRLAG